MENTVGSFVREQREAAGLTQRQLADTVGITAAFLSQVELGTARPPSEEKIRAIALALGVDPDVLLQRAGRIPADILDAVKKHPEVWPDLRSR